MTGYQFRPPKRLYDDPRWRPLCERYLATHRWCVMCAACDPPRDTPATVVDHRVPHRNDPRLFFARDNWQALCESCHVKAKQILERTGVLIGARQDGTPLDPRHHWNT